MSKILELMEKRNKAVNAARAFLDSKSAVSDILSAEDETAYEKMETGIQSLTKAIDRESRMNAITDTLKQPTTEPILNSVEPTADTKIGRASDAYRKDFINAMRTTKVTDLLQTGVDADGGFLVPDEFERSLLKGLEEANVMRSLAKTISTSAERKIPVVATETTASWVAENGQIPESSMTFGQKSLDAFKLTDMIRVSTELLQDSFFNLEGYLAQEFARALGVAEEEAFLVGTGAGQPTGIFTANGGEVGTTTATANITFDDIITLIYALKSPYRRNAAFLMHDSTIGAVRKLKDNNGCFLWQPSLQAGEPDKLFGYPIYTSPYAPQIKGGALPIAFGDMSNYWIADRQTRSIQRLNELYAKNGQVGFLVTERLDGKVILGEGIKLLKIAGSGA